MRVQPNPYRLTLLLNLVDSRVQNGEEATINGQHIEKFVRESIVESYGNKGGDFRFQVILDSSQNEVIIKCEAQ